MQRTGVCSLHQDIRYAQEEVRFSDDSHEFLAFVHGQYRDLILTHELESVHEVGVRVYGASHLEHMS